jgi:hypothetical protein
MRKRFDSREELADRDRSIARLQAENAQLRDEVQRLRNVTTPSPPRRTNEEIAPIWTSGRDYFEPWERLVMERLETFDTANRARWLLEDNWQSLAAYERAVPGAGKELIERIRKRIAELTAEGAL